MPAKTTIYRSIDDLKADVIPAFNATLKATASSKQKLSGICGFDGFIDTFIHFEQPKSMAELGPKITAAAGIATSYSVRHLGDKFGGNGPLFAAGLNDIHEGNIDITYIGALGREKILPVFEDALKGKTQQIFSLADPAHSDCLEFTDGKIMLSDLSACAEITLERLLECVGQETLDKTLKDARFIGAVNWGKLIHVGEVWSYLAQRLEALGVAPKSVVCFMDLAEFEGRAPEDLQDLLKRLSGITRQCTTILSFNLKEAWQMGSVFGGNFHGRKDADSVAELATLLRSHTDVDKIIIHPNDGAVCASAEKTIYVPGPFCKQPLISTGAGDNFGAGCLAAMLAGMDDAGVLLAGNCASGHFVRSGRSATFPAMLSMVELWSKGELPERL